MTNSVGVIDQKSLMCNSVTLNQIFKLHLRVLIMRSIMNQIDIFSVYRASEILLIIFSSKQKRWKNKDFNITVDMMAVLKSIQDIQIDG